MNAIANALKTVFGSGKSSSLGHNFRTYGTSFGIYDYSEFEMLARKFYQDAMHSEDPEYTIVKMNGGRTAVDYSGEVRGVYDKFGNPIAFFRPSYRSQGFKNREEEMEQFKSGGKLVY